MAGRKRDDIRLLSKNEQDMIAQTRQPAVKTLSDRDLVALAKSLRERRDQAQEISRYLRREIRGRTKKLSLTTTAHNPGARAKLTLLAAAVKRANKEMQRRLVAGRRHGSQPER